MKRLSILCFLILAGCSTPSLKQDLAIQWIAGCMVGTAISHQRPMDDELYYFCEGILNGKIPEKRVAKSMDLLI